VTHQQGSDVGEFTDAPRISMEFEESLGNSHHREDRLRRRHRHAGVAAANGDVTLLRIHSSSVADASAPSAS